MSAPTAWITGTGGLIGSHLARLAPALAPAWNLVPLSRPVLDLTDLHAVEARFRREQPALLLHCAALSNTRACEDHPALAHQLNVQVTTHLANLFAQARMVFFSTDLVFDGAKGWYVETDPPHPLGVYASTKVEAEHAVLKYPGHLVVRTSLNGGVSPTGDRGFNEQLRHTWKRGQTAHLFTDEFRCPIPASVTARAVWELALQPSGGVWHVAGAQRLSRWEMGELIAQRWPELKPRIQPNSLKHYQGAPRAPDCSLNCAKAQSVLSFKLPGLAEWLEAHPGEPF